MRFDPFNNPRLMFRAVDGALYKGGSSTSATTASATSVSDSRVGVADQGVYAGGDVSQGNDLRTFDDHSSFNVESTSNTSTANSNNDNRVFDDHSSFSSVVQDNRDFSDHSQFTATTTDSRVTNITSLDPAVAQAATDAARRSAEASSAASSDASRRAAEASAAASGSSRDVALAGLNTATQIGRQSTQLFDAAVNFGESVSGESYRAANATTELAFDAVNANQRDAFQFGRDAFGFSAEAGEAAAGLISKAIDTVAKSADADRAFAGEFTGKIFDTTKSADQANVEKLTKGATIILGVAFGAWAVKSIFAPARHG